MVEENKENRAMIEATLSQIKSLIEEGKLEEANERFSASKKDLPDEALKGIIELLQKTSPENVAADFLTKADEFIKQGYTPENMQYLTDMFDNVKDPLKKRDILSKLHENPQAKPFIAGLIMQAYEKELANHMKQSISAPTNNEQNNKQYFLAQKLNEAREVMHQMDVLPSIEETPQSPKHETSQPAPRSQTAEIGEKPQKRGFLTRLKDRVEQFKLDYHYSGIVGALGYREQKGDGTFLRNRFTDITKDFSHIKELDFNRYPNMSTFKQDLTGVDHVVLPDPKKNPIIDLSGSKLKGKVDLSAYDHVVLAEADLSKVSELDLSGCKNIDLRGVDLSNVKLKLPERTNYDIVLYDTKLPKTDKLDLSQAKLASMRNTDFSQVNTVVMPQQTFGRDISGWPKHVDASACQSFIARRCDMSNVEKITPPANSHNGPTATKFELSKCSLPNVATLDVSTCGNVWMTDNNMPALKNLKIRGNNPLEDYMCNNKVENLENISIRRGYVQPRETYNNMFQTYKNISLAVEQNRTVYKDAETGKLCPLTENQKKAIEVIKSSARFNGDGLAGFWDTMKTWCNDPQSLKASAHLSHGSNTKQQQVLTEYNKALSQALGLKSYINMETLKYEKTPPLKEGEQIEIPPFNRTQYNKLASNKSNNLDKWGRPQTQIHQGNISQTRRQNQGK